MTSKGNGIIMNIQTLARLSKMTLLALAVSLMMLALVYLLQHPNLVVTLATVSWNG
jgi:hypothetical protein